MLYRLSYAHHCHPNTREPCVSGTPGLARFKNDNTRAGARIGWQVVAGETERSQSSLRFATGLDLFFARVPGTALRCVPGFPITATGTQKARRTIAASRLGCEWKGTVPQGGTVPLRRSEGCRPMGAHRQECATCRPRRASVECMGWRTPQSSESGVEPPHSKKDA